MQEMQERLVQSLDLEDPLEEGMTSHSSILAVKIPRTEEPGGLKSMGSQKIRQNSMKGHFSNCFQFLPSGWS